MSSRNQDAKKNGQFFITRMIIEKNRTFLFVVFIAVFQFAMLIRFHIFVKKEENFGEAKFHLREFKQDNTMNLTNSICLSPEKDVEWVLDGTCMDDPYLPNFSNTGLDHSCGFCGEKVEYLRSLRDEIAAEYSEECRGLVVYGAALGPKYEGWLRSPKWMGTQSIDSKRKHKTCFFQFVTDTDDTGDQYSLDGGSQRLIVVDPAKLPYANNRRNTKLLKYNPGLLFPWADRIIWEDAKLLQANPGKTDSTRYTVPSDYLFHFDQTVQRFGACASVMSLPLHKAAIGQAPTMSLRAHCDTIITASVKRPSVSDNLDVLVKQCNRYDQMHHNSKTPSSRVYAQAPLADTAFIVYDMRTPICKKFNGDLGCSMLDEIHCYSDRDQIPFPSIVASSGLKLSPELDVEGYETRDRVYVNDNNIPMLHMAKRSCHWYYGNFRGCAVTDKELPPPRQRSPRDTKSGKLKIAIVVAGTLKKLMFHSMLENMIQPLGKDNEVDLYGTFTTGKVQAYKHGDADIYPKIFQMDPFLPKPTSDDYGNVERFLRRKTANHGGYVGAMYIKKKIDFDSEPKLKAKRADALKKYPDEDPDTRFPIYDMRTKEIGEKTLVGNKNLLRMHLAIKNLWEEVLEVEAENNFKYDYIIFMREDLFWLEKLDITNIHKKEGDVFVLSCDLRNPPHHPMEENDHILITRRKHAGIFGNYFKNMLEIDTHECNKRLSDAVTKKGKRGCNSQMLFKYVMDMNKINVTRLGQSEIPFQRGANVKMPDGKNVQCFNKYCQSKESPLKMPENKKSCMDIDWKEFYLYGRK